MSRTERIPAISPASTTTRWRKPPLDHRGGSLLERPRRAREHEVGGQVVGDLLGVRVLAAGDRQQDVALGDDPRPHPVGIVDDRRPDARSAIAAEAWRSVCPGPTVRTTVLIPSRTCIVTTPSRFAMRRSAQSLPTGADGCAGHADERARSGRAPGRQERPVGLAPVIRTRAVARIHSRADPTPCHRRAALEPLRGRHRDRGARVRRTTSRSTTSPAASPPRAASCSARSPRSGTRRSATS